MLVYDIKSISLDGIPVVEFWDLGEQHKALEELLDSGRFDVNDKRIVIPGCGCIIVLNNNAASHLCVCP